MSGNDVQNTKDQALWAAFVNGDNSSIESLYRRYFDELYAFGIKWLADVNLTEDSIQDLFVKLMRNRKNLSLPVSVRFYLFRSFRSVVMDKLKQKNKPQQLDEAGMHLFSLDINIEKQLIQSEDETALNIKLTRALEALTPRQREAIFLRYIEGFSYLEVAEMMGLTTKGTYKLIARAIEALKTQMPGAVLLYFFNRIF